MAMNKKQTSGEIEIMEVAMGVLEVHLVGTSPLIMNRLSNKAKHELLLPEVKKKNRAERSSVLKHDPLGEFRESVYLNRSTAEPTLFHMPSGAIRKAVAKVATYVPGSNRTEIGTLVTVPEQQINIWGVPSLYMATVRQAGMQRTPDIRTRAGFQTWATLVRLRYVKSLLNERTIGNLLGASGMLIGIGDGRTEKGTFSFGAFKVVASDDPELRQLLKAGGRKQQEQAMQAPGFFDAESQELYSWFEKEVDRREIVPKSRSKWSPEDIVSHVNA